MSEKQSLRLVHLTKRKQFQAQVVKESSAKINERLLALFKVLGTKFVCAYKAINNEIDVHATISKCPDINVTPAVPYINEDGSMTPVTVSALTEYETGAYGVAMPTNGEKHETLPEDSVVLVPGVVFDYEGNRIGYGKGYYDKFLKKMNPKYIIGVAFEEQLSAEKIPVEEHDVPMDMLITPSTFYIF